MVLDRSLPPEIQAAHDDIVSMRGLGPRRQRRAAAVKGVLEGSDE